MWKLPWGLRQRLAAFRDGVPAGKWNMHNFSSSGEMKDYIDLCVRNRDRNFVAGEYFPPKTSYSQSGEDLITNFIFSSQGINRGTFLDIGCHHPFDLNNTALLYEKGWRGINIDPIEERIALFRDLRQGDVNICAGVGERTEKSDFFLMEAEALSTFDPDVYENYLSQGYKLKEKREVDFFTIRDILDKTGVDSLDLLTVDIEGDDTSVVAQLLEYGVRPKVIICESVFFSPHIDLRMKNKAAVSAVTALGYQVYADTFINTIFLDQEFIS